MKTKTPSISRLESLFIHPIVIGCIHILQGLWNTIEAVIDLTEPNPEFPEAVLFNSVLTITMALIFALVGALLIIGAWKRSHLLLLPWLFLVGLSLAFCYAYIATNIADIPIRTWGNLAMLMVNFSIIGFCTYVWFAILVFYKNIRDEKRMSNEDDVETLCAHSHRTHDLNEVSYPPPYIIPVEFFNSKEPPTQIKY